MKVRRKKRKDQNLSEEADQPLRNGEEPRPDFSKKTKRKKRKDRNLSGEGDQQLREDGEPDRSEVRDTYSGNKEASEVIRSESKKAKRKKRKDVQFSRDSEQALNENSEADQDEVHHISSGDEDGSKGMKKWVTDYFRSRPGLKILQQRIDDFITTHEAKLEQERKEREALASEGGWTVVTHHKGRKKTTDSESGIVVGSVSQAALEDKMAKKKRKEVGLDFYRFHRREAQRNEILKLQTKFEQDRKRIQQLRAARKFRPY